jgi:hypothetical protein
VLLEPAPPETEVVMTSNVETPTEIRPFTVDIPEDELAELRRRIAATRWPDRETRCIAGRAARDDPGIVSFFSLRYGCET